MSVTEEVSKCHRGGVKMSPMMCQSVTEVVKSVTEEVSKCHLRRIKASLVRLVSLTYDIVTHTPVSEPLYLVGHDVCVTETIYIYIYQYY